MSTRTFAAGTSLSTGRKPLAGRYFRDFDVIMLVTTIVLIGFGCLAIMSASGVEGFGLDNPGVRQAVLASVGIVLCLVVSTIDYRFIASAAWVLYGLGLAALGLVLVPGIGSETLGARRWFDFGGFVTLQPSEFTKVTTAIALAAFISSRQESMRAFGDFVLSLVIVGIPMAMIIAEPDVDSALTYLIIWCAMMLVSRPRWLHLGMLAVGGIAVVVVALNTTFLLREYHRERISAFIDSIRGVSDRNQDVNFQQMQATISIGSGGMFGNGMEGGFSSDLLSVRTSDFVFAHASSMFGFVGMIALFACYVILLWRFLRVVEIARDGFGRCFAIGITGMIFAQAVINIAMNLSLLPVAGIPLPFVSVGVSSLWAFLIAEGILQSILMYHRKLAFQPD